PVGRDNPVRGQCRARRVEDRVRGDRRRAAGPGVPRAAAAMTDPPREYRLYRDLAGWWPLISPVEHYAEEAAWLTAVLDSAPTPVRQVLDLGSGGGHLAVH